MTTVIALMTDVVTTEVEADSFSFYVHSVMLAHYWLWPGVRPAVYHNPVFC